MNNGFYQICVAASQNNWCWRLSCTTCGQRQFRIALSALDDDTIKEVSLFNIEKNCIFPDWLGYLGLVLDDYNRRGKNIEEISCLWASQLSQMVSKNSVVYQKLIDISSGRMKLEISDLELVELGFRHSSEWNGN